ncbi:MAG: hypothetical protein Q9174_006976, partial [Haloplaca sp. 1 TL-2023]
SPRHPRSSEHSADSSVRVLGCRSLRRRRQLPRLLNPEKAIPQAINMPASRQLQNPAGGGEEIALTPHRKSGLSRGFGAQTLGRKQMRRYKRNVFHRRNGNARHVRQ